MGNKPTFVKCADCGFLGKRSLGEQIPTVIEITNTEREKCSLEPIAGRATRSVCYRNKAQYTFQSPSHDSAKLRDEIQEVRECQYWYSYEEGRSPREHFEELRMLQLEQRREEFEQNMEQRRKEFELKLEKGNKEEQRRTNRIMIWLTIAAVIFAALQVYAALASINPNHWLFEWLR